MQRIQFQLERDPVELKQLHKLIGLCDNGSADKALVANDAMSMDRAIELRKTCKIRAAKTITIGDVEIRADQQGQLAHRADSCMLR